MAEGGAPPVALLPFERAMRLLAKPAHQHAQAALVTPAWFALATRAGRTPTTAGNRPWLARMRGKSVIGCLVVTDGAGRIEGIFTERDIVNRLVAEDKDASATKVGDLMTREVIVVEPERTLDEIEAIMKQNRVRHFPVAGNEAPLGLLSIGDVLAYHAAANKQMVHYLTEYMYERHLRPAVAAANVRPGIVGLLPGQQDARRRQEQPSAAKTHGRRKNTGPLSFLRLFAAIRSLV